MTELDRSRLGAARLRLTHPGTPWGMPYFRTAVMSLIPVASDSVGTLGVDKHWRLYCDPDFVANTDIDQLAAALAHEIGHLLREHHGRQAASGVSLSDSRVWNIAGDMCINQDLRNSDVPLPGGVMYPETFNLPPNLTVEEYFSLLRDLRDEQADDGSGGEGGGRGDQFGGPGQGGGPGDGQDCGSCSSEGKRPWEGATDEPGLSPAAADQVVRATAREVQQHAKTQGNVPAEWVRWANELLEPVVDWRKWLTGQISAARRYVSGRVDYSYRRPHRRGQINGVVFPSMIAPVPKVRIVVDTSGSMSEAELGRALAEINGIIKAQGVATNDLDVISCDVDAHVTRGVVEARRVELVGGGGTDLRVGIRYAAELRPAVDIIIVLTDGYTPWPDEPMRERVIAGIIGEDTNIPEPPDWIPTIRIPYEASR